MVVPPIRALAWPVLLGVLAGVLYPGLLRAEGPSAASAAPYVKRPARGDGTGRFCLGREIGRVMPREAASSSSSPGARTRGCP
jgi:hypothetical protein